MRGIKSDQAQAEVTGALLGPRGNWNKSQSKKGIQELHQQMLGHGEPPGKARTPLLGLEEGKDGMPGLQVTGMTFHRTGTAVSDGLCAVRCCVDTGLG